MSSDSKQDSDLSSMMVKSIALVVDDDLEFQTVLASALETDGYHVLRAGNGVEALQVLSECAKTSDILQLEVIVSDLIMPQMNGFELLENIRNGPYANIPFVILSGGLDQKSLNQLIQLGVDGVLYKPLKRAELFTKVSEAIVRNQKKMFMKFKV